MRVHADRRRVLRGLAAASAAPIAGCLGDSGPPAEAVEAARSHLEPYRDPETALSDGYKSTSQYVASDDGVLGTPFVDASRGDATASEDALVEDRPRWLYYDLDERGRYELVAAEWSVPTEAASEPPSMFGIPFHGPQEGHLPGQPEHYGLHVWTVDNPDGVTAPSNPGLRPPDYVDDVEEVRDVLTPYLRANGGALEAEEDGYVDTEKVVETDDGMYGIPFVKDPTGGTDPTDPPILLYLITETWTYVLWGAEWFVPADEVDSPPEMFGQRFHEPMDGHSDRSDQPRHYGLHAWLFRANPGGLFEPFNTSESAPAPSTVHRT